MKTKLHIFMRLNIRLINITWLIIANYARISDKQTNNNSTTKTLIVQFIPL
jgi:hypothetical protein